MFPRFFRRPAIKRPYDSPAAQARAQQLVSQMSLAEKLDYIKGYKLFFIKALPRLGLPAIFMADASQGIHLRFELDQSLAKLPENTTAFPCLVNLAATWNPELARLYAKAVGREARICGVHFLLGPGVNIYRNAQCGRNFEYLGEDPLLAARIVEAYVEGVQSLGVAATVKHFVCNNAEYYRRRSNSVVSDRALREIYLPAFKAAIDAGAVAVMTAYNQLNGEWCGQSAEAINGLLRSELGFGGLVMSDWWSLYDREKTIKSGLDLDMPGESLTNIEELIDAGRVSIKDIDRMVTSILTSLVAMDFLDRPQQDEALLATYPQIKTQHQAVALETARQGLVLLKNNGVLPLKPDSRILATGGFLHKIPTGGGSAQVEGYNQLSLAQALQDRFQDRLIIKEIADEAEIRAADVVIVSTGTEDSEGWDRPFDLPAKTNAELSRICQLNPRTIVLVNSGSAIGMTAWNDAAAAILYAWYPGQIGNAAVAEILDGTVNPSGRLPFTIEKSFVDSPAHAYIPKGESLYEGWLNEREALHPVFNIDYTEEVFVGYRWYESRGKQTLYAFGHGLSYTDFEYSDLSTDKSSYLLTEKVTVQFSLTNRGQRSGREIAQLYVADPESSQLRPVKELKAFQSLQLEAGEKQIVSFQLGEEAFAFWHSQAQRWLVEPGEFQILVGRSSADIRLEVTIELK